MLNSKILPTTAALAGGHDVVRTVIGIVLVEMNSRSGAIIGEFRI